MICDGCGNKTARRIRRYLDGTEICDGCGGIQTVAGVPDVYWDGKPEINLADGPDGKPRTFSSKGEKSRYLKEHGLIEAGDRVRGSLVTGLESPARKDSREQVREALHRVKSMGRDVRRQEVLRIVKEGQRNRS